MSKVRKQFILDEFKIKQAKKILHTSTDTETVNEALNQVIANHEILEAHRKLAGKLKLKNMDQSRLK